MNPPPHPMLSRRALFVVATGTILSACTREPPVSPPRTLSARPTPSPTPTALTVTVNGRAVDLPHGSNVQDAIEAAGLDLRHGDLYDLDGKLLERRWVEPTYRLGDRDVTRFHAIHHGATLVAVRGKDKKEDIVTRRERIGVPENPQYLLGGEQGRLEVEQGRVSGTVVSMKFKLERGEYTPRAAALTFDDGPHPIGTPMVLKALKELDAHATFFVVGALVERYPDVVKQIVDEGHAIGTHSWSHPGSFANLSSSTLRTEVLRPVDALERLDIQADWFRPPGGSFDAGVVALAAQGGMRTVMWSIGTGDFRDEIPAHHVENSVKRQLRKGAIILMHDGGNNYASTAKVLPDVVRELEKENFSIGKLEPNLREMRKR